MPVIEDLKTAVDNYPEQKVDVTITDFALIGSGSALNTNEKAKYQILVANNGELHMLNTTVRVLGTSFADVSPTENGPFTSSFTTDLATINAGKTKKSVPLFLRAKAATSGSQDIVKARIDAWDAGLDHILKGHSNAGPNEGKLNKTVVPT